MKKQLILLLGILLLLPSLVSAAPSIAERLKGRILLQVESRGEAYYVSPVTAERYYMENGDAAYNVMRNFGIGITNTDLEKIKNNKTLALKHKGKIFLQVELHGEAYYVDFSGNLHYLKDGSEAYNIMRTLGLGITNNDLAKINSNQLTPTPTPTPTSTLLKIDSEYAKFKSMFTINKAGINKYNQVMYDAQYNGVLNQEEFWSYFSSINTDSKIKFAKQLATEVSILNIGYSTGLDFKYSSTLLGYAYDYPANEYNNDAYSVANFSENPFTIQTQVTPTVLNNDSNYVNFKSIFTINKIRVTENDEILYNAQYNGVLNQEEFWSYFSSINADSKIEFAKQLATEVRNNDTRYTIALYFKYLTTDLGYAFAYPEDGPPYGYALATFTKNPFIVQTPVIPAQVTPTPALTYVMPDKPIIESFCDNKGNCACSSIA